MMAHVAAFFVTFTSVFLKGFQYKNVIGNHHRAMFFTSYFLAVCDVLTVGLVVNKGWVLCFAAGTGGALGMVGSVYAHNKLLKKKGTTNETP